MASIDKPQESTMAFPGQTRRRRIGLPTLSLRASERRLLLFIVDVILLNAALVVALAVSTDILPPWPAVVAAYKWFLTLTIAWLPIAAVFDLYNLARAASTTYILKATIPATVIATFGYVWIPYFTPPIVNRSQVFLFIILAVVFVAAWRAAYALLFVQPAFMRRALVVGAGASGRALASALQNNEARHDHNPFRGTGYQLVGFVDDEPALTGQKIEAVPVWGTGEQLVRLARTLRVDEVFVAITKVRTIRPELMESILDCRELGIPVSNFTTVYERLTRRVPVAFASQDIEIAAGTADTPFVRFYRLLKRALDLLFGFYGLLMLLLFMPVVAIANRLTAPGPLFYRQQRVGRGGKPFTVLKFRSMVPDAEKGSARWASKDDDRITPVGRVLRATHLDELPQVINVLRGEMSVVGPRPERPEFVGQLSRTIPFYRARHCVRPGITGWAQIHQDYGDSIDAAEEKLEYDLYYIKHAGPMLDALILLRTVTKVLGLKGR